MGVCLSLLTRVRLLFQRKGGAEYEKLSAQMSSLTASAPSPRSGSGGGGGGGGGLPTTSTGQQDDDPDGEFADWDESAPIAVVPATSNANIGRGRYANNQQQQPPEEPAPPPPMPDYFSTLGMGISSSHVQVTRVQAKRPLSTGPANALADPTRNIYASTAAAAPSHMAHSSRFSADLVDEPPTGAPAAWGDDDLGGLLGSSSAGGGKGSAAAAGRKPREAQPKKPRGIGAVAVALDSEACDEPPLGAAAGPPEDECAAVMRKATDADAPASPDPDAAAAAVVVDSSCTTAALLQYYDDCAEWYDHTDEGDAEDTYICVDRVTNTFMREYRHPHHHHHQHQQPRPTLTGVLAFDSLALSEPADELDTSAGSSIDLPATVEGPSPSASPQPSESLASASSSSASVTASSSDSSPPSTPTHPVDDSPRSRTTRSLSRSPSRSATSTPTPVPAASAFSSSLPSPSAASSSSVLPLKILDLGVGTGLASRPLFAHLSTPRLSVPRRSRNGEPKLEVPHGTQVPEIWGTDLSTNMLKVASVLPFKHLIAGDLNQCLYDPSVNPSSPLARLPPGWFDAVVCVGTCEFVRDLVHFFDQVSHFLRPGGLFTGTFPSNQTRTYPDMSWTTVDQLTTIVQAKGMAVVEIQQYRGWSVSADEHVEYIQLCVRR